MPEEKWVTPNNIHTNAEAQCINASLEKEALPKLQFTPVLTLDQLEAWLKDMRSPLCNFRPTPQANRIAIGVYGDLIAQVQAWKATHTRSER